MLIVIDTGLATTKAAVMAGAEISAVSFSSSVVRGLIGEQAGGVYCIGKTTNNFQIFSALAQEHGVFPVGAGGFRDKTNGKRRVLIEHAMTLLGAMGQTNLILTQPALAIFNAGENQTDRIRLDEAELMKMPVCQLDPKTEKATAPKWKIGEVSVSVEAAWAVYDLAITTPADAETELRNFTSEVGEGAVIAVVDIGATGSRIHYVEWTGELLPTLVMSRYTEFAIGSDEVVSQLDERLVARHKYHDVLDLPALVSTPVVQLAVGEVGISDLIEEATSVAASRLNVAGFSRLVDEVNSGEVARVLLVGGGSRVLGPSLEAQLDPSVILKVANPEQAGVRGLLKARASADGAGRSK